MPLGKQLVQAAHASCGPLPTASLRPEYAEWQATGSTKICVRVKNRAALEKLYQASVEAGLPVFLVADEGRTVFAAPTITCLGLGPALRDALNPLTRRLRLLSTTPP